MKEIGNFKAFQGSECLMSCIQNYFMNKDIPIYEEEVFIIGDGLHTTYRRIDMDGEFKFGILSDVHRSIGQFCNYIGIGFAKYKEVSDEAAEKGMMYNLSKGEPVIAMVDSGYLKYSPIYLNGFGLTHYICIIGEEFSELEKKVKICDGFIPTFPVSTYQGWVDYSDIKDGRKSKGNEFIEIDCNSFEIRRYREKLSQGLIRRKLRENLIEYLNCRRQGNEFLGTAALTEFSRDLPHFIEYYGDNFTERMTKLNYELKIYGLVTSRQLLYKVIQRMNTGEGGRWNEEEMQMKNINKKWDNLSLKIVKVGISRQQSLLDQLAIQIRDILNDETALFEKMLTKFRDR